MPCAGLAVWAGVIGLAASATAQSVRRPGSAVPVAAGAAASAAGAVGTALPGLSAGPTLAPTLSLPASVVPRPAVLARSPSAPIPVRVSGYVVNDEGLRVAGKAAEYYREIRRVVERYRGRVDLSESLDVMDDAYADVFAKLAAIEAVARSRGVSRENTHLEETLLWVDGVLQQGGRRVAVNTHRVYFHHAGNPRSEIEEGLRRVKGYLDETLALFERRGEAEKALGPLDEVVLAFDARGYAEIKAYLKEREREAAARYGRRFRFAYLDELAETPRDPAELRRRLDALTVRYEGNGLSKIIEGVVYSRYVGLLLELKTIAHLVDRGWGILQSGRELFDKDGLYITELDVVARSPQGRVSLIEAKSARVRLPPRQVLADKVERKLETYRRHRAELESAVGAPVDEVVFAMDLGPNTALAPFLEGKAKSLSKRYGFPVRFLFLQSGPEDSLPRPGLRRRR